MKKDKNFGLQKLTNSVAKKSEDFLKEIQDEIIGEEKEALKDFIKGAYRLKIEKEKEIEALAVEVKSLEEAVDAASSGDWDKISKIKIPARFFNESTLRKHGKSLLEGSSEVRFMDLYVKD